MPVIPPQSDKALNCYHQKLSWKISKDDWGSVEQLHLKLETKIPGTSSNEPGGLVWLGKRRNSIGFSTLWPKEVNDTKVSLVAFFTIKLDDGSSVLIKCDKIRSMRKESENTNSVSIYKYLKLNPVLLYDEEACFTIEAELKVAHEETNDDINSKRSGFVKDIAGIFSDSKTSDVVVIAGGKKFYCHKNILSARCEVFRNMLAPNTLESELNTIEVKEVPPEPVESMLMYLYTGEVPEDPEQLTLDLLNLSEMYLLDCLKESCLKRLMASLEVSSCISTFIMAEMYIPGGGNLKENVIMFMKCKAEELVEMEDWDKLVDNHPALAKELMRAIVKGSKEKHKCQFCMVSYDK